jgi:hypothetical protein
MNETRLTTPDNGQPSEEQLESRAIALALKLVNESETWARQDRAVYTSEVMERELNDLFPVESFLERKRQNVLKTTED